MLLELKGSEKMISVSIVSWYVGENEWALKLGDEAIFAVISASNMYLGDLEKLSKFQLT